jgi:site-specific DNA-methyltransferase (adenine-specific)
MRVETIGDATLYLGDCMEILPTLGKVDAVITDPPYGIDVGKMGMGKGAKASSFDKFDWDCEAPNLSDILCAGSVQIIWGGNYFELPVSGSWLAWDKVQTFSGADMELAWTNLGKPIKAFRMSRIEAYGSIDKQHPTQKPLALMKWCIEQAGRPAVTLDPFMGSGTTGVAAVGMGLGFIGIEREPKYFEIACKRIEQAYNQRPLFEAEPAPQPVQMGFIA